MYAVFRSVPSILGQVRGPLQFVVALAVVGAVAVTPVSAFADPAPLSPSGDIMNFPRINGPSDPEEYSWEVELGEDQSLVWIDPQTAEVVYEEEGIVAFSFHAEAAHDAAGATVPTSLAVSEGKIITLFVHHRAGNPLTGEPFEYPVTSGKGWEGGFVTEVVGVPPSSPPPSSSAERTWRYVEGPPWLGSMPWYTWRRGDPLRRMHNSLVLHISTGYCVGEPPPVIARVRVVERPKTVERPFKSAVVTAFVRFPAPTEVVGTVTEGGPQPGCAGLGLTLRRRVRFKRPVARLFVFDGSRVPLRRVLRPIRAMHSTKH